MAILRRVIDPELGSDIVELGMAKVLGQGPAAELSGCSACLLDAMSAALDAACAP